jgi:hypothetical protein
MRLEKYYTMPVLTANGKINYKDLSTTTEDKKTSPSLIEYLNSLKPEVDTTEETLQNRLLMAMQEKYSLLAILALRCRIINYAVEAIQYSKLKNLPSKQDSSDLVLSLYACIVDDSGKLIYQIRVGNAHLSLILNVMPTYPLRIKFIYVPNPSNEQGVKIGKPFSFYVLETFKIDKQIKLNTWVNQLIWTNKEVKNTLKQFGIYSKRFWAYLARHTPEQIERLEKEFSSVSPATIKEDVELISIIREIQKESKLSGNGMSIDDKLKNMGNRLENKPVDLKKRLLEIVERLSKIEANNEKPSSLNKPIGTNEDEELLNIIPSPRDLNNYEILEQGIIEKYSTHNYTQFAYNYNKNKNIWLKQGIREAIMKKPAYIGSNIERRLNLLNGLNYFYNDQLTMVQIANHLGLNSYSNAQNLLNLTHLIKQSFKFMVNIVNIHYSGHIKTLMTDSIDFKIVSNPENLPLLLKEQYKDMWTLMSEANQERCRPDCQRNSLFAKGVCAVVNQLLTL